LVYDDCIKGKRQMDAKDLDILMKFKNLLLGRVRLHQVIIFGSRARGNAEPDSDMDVLVVLDQPIIPEVRGIVSNCAWEAGFDAGIVIATIVVSRDKWENGPERSSLLAIAVRQEGALI
ncbi:nucleotidyltransferase domain-containing protein, partial [Candidatus Sumerlaeota bacterium]|nr:nucleotidyltransferase domain-containing protein [Candidatus Sumerlaeota bacterium]